MTTHIKILLRQAKDLVATFIVFLKPKLSKTSQRATTPLCPVSKCALKSPTKMSFLFIPNSFKISSMFKVLGKTHYMLMSFGLADMAFLNDQSRSKT